MLHPPLIFFIMALIAAVYGFGIAAAGPVADVCQVLFFAFTTMSVVTLVAALSRRL